VIDIGFIDDLSGLAQAITYTIRVSCWAGLKAVTVEEIVMIGQN
jgi:hypothetical protein